MRPQKQRQNNETSARIATIRAALESAHNGQFLLKTRGRWFAARGLSFELDGGITRTWRFVDVEDAEPLTKGQAKRLAAQIRPMPGSSFEVSPRIPELHFAISVLQSALHAGKFTP